MKIDALLFDVFGTLVDWRGGIAASVVEAFAGKAADLDAARFARAWRAAYDPAMAPIRAGRRSFVPLDELHRENLERVLTANGLSAQLSAEEKTTLNRAWERLPPWPDVRPGLSLLKDGFILAPCSNGSIALMIRLARHAGLDWDCILGAEIAQDYKPSPAVYRSACAALRLPPERVMMVAAHNGDLAAAQAVGLRTGFFPRPSEHGPGQTTDLGPEGAWDIVADDLPGLAAALLDLA
ncbi:MAG: haloacid dehalogenase type II [Pseudomonadota bacterium]